MCFSMVKRIPIPRAYVRESDPEVLKQFLKKVPKEKRVRVKSHMCQSVSTAGTQTISDC